MYEVKYTLEWDGRNLDTGEYYTVFEVFSKGADARNKAFELCHTKGVKEVQLWTQEIWRDGNENCR